MVTPAAEVKGVIAHGSDSSDQPALPKTGLDCLRLGARVEHSAGADEGGGGKGDGGGRR